MDEWKAKELRCARGSKNSSSALRAAAVKLSDKRKLFTSFADAGDANSKRSSRGSSSKCKKCSASCGNAWVALTVWRHSFKQIEGMYGSGVLAYFSFLKTMFIMDLVCAIIIGVLVILPQSLNFGLLHQIAMVNALQSSSEPNAAAAYNCSIAYDKVLVSTINNSTLLTTAQDVLQGTGFLEASAILFIGNYFPDFVSLSSLQYNMPLAYMVALGLVYLFCLVYMLMRTSESFRQAIMHQATQHKEVITHLALADWDFSLMDEANSKQAMMMARNSFLSELDEQLYKQQTHSKSGCSCFLLWLRRILVNLIVLGLMGGGGYLIYFAQITSASYLSSNPSTSSSFDMVRLIYEYLPVIAVAVVSGVLPVIFQLLVRIENYRKEAEVFVTLIRTTFTSLAALAVFMASVFSVVLCSTKNYCNIGTGSCDPITCWETYVGQEFFKMALMFFLKLLIMTFIVDFTRSMIGKNCSCKFAKLIGPAEFDIPKHVLEVISSQITLWFGVFFCPILAPVTAVIMFLSFYFKKFGCYMNFKPSERPFKATRATTFFMVATFIGFFMCILPVGFLITQVSPSRSCSPFRKNETIYEIVPGVVAQFPTEVQFLLDFISSPGFMYFLILLVIIIIYYYAAVASAEKQRLEIYEKFLEEEGVTNLLHKLSTDGTSPNPALEAKFLAAAVGGAAAGKSSAKPEAQKSKKKKKEEEEKDKPNPVKRDLQLKSAFELGLGRE